MTKHLTPQETRGALRDARDELRTVEEHDGVRNAALFATVPDTLQRFHDRPHVPETTINAVKAAGDRVAGAYRVADAYRATVSRPLIELANDPDHAVVVEAAHNGVAQYAAATRQLADALEDYQLALFNHLGGVMHA